MKKPILASLCLVPTALTLQAADLTESTFTQVINSVSVVTPGTQQTQKAEVNGIVKAPQLVRTGPNSRAELLAKDQTLTRVGANTLFSFEPKGRHINLQQGSVLFHSPPGRGGGTIKTGGAAAAVLGTTIMIVATPNGGFKGVVLEGKGRFTLPGGGSRDLKAGQLLFVLPGVQGFGPTLNINLAKMVEGSGLVQGYASALPSIAKVESAVAAQASAISSGKLQDTGLLVGNTATKEEVAVIDQSTFEAAVKENKSRLEQSWDKDIEVRTEILPGDRLFGRSDENYPKRSLWADTVTLSMLGEDIKLNTHSVFLPELPSPAEGQPAPVIGIIAQQTLSVEEDLDFYTWQTPPNERPGLALGGDEVKIYNNKDLRYDSANGLFLGARKSISIKGSKIENRSGTLVLKSENGSIKQEGGTLVAGAQASLDLSALKNNEKIELSNVSLAGGSLNIQAEDKVQLSNVNFTRSGYSSQFGSISMAAKTIVFSDVSLPDQPMLLKTREGALAPNPNKQTAVMNGYVNFYRDVTVRGEPAQLYVKGHPGARDSANITIEKLK